MHTPQQTINQVATHFDVIVIGAGTAGCSTAINLAPHYKVALIDRSQTEPFKIGESLPPVSRRILTDMDIWDDFLQQNHQPCFGNRSIWASTDIIEADFLRDPYGHGWHLDRAQFDLWLKEHAINRGAQTFIPFKLNTYDYQDGQWYITLSSSPENTQHITADIVIDATGRACPIPRKLGVKRIVTDKRVCGWMVGSEQPTPADAGFSYIEACAEGWWYSAPIPDNRRILAFFTDTGLASTQYALKPKKLLDFAQQHTEISALLKRCQFKASNITGYNAAHTSYLEQYTGQQWLTVGDASMSFDPLSSQGLFNALYTALYASKAVQKYFSNQCIDFSEYENQLNNIQDAYKNHLNEWYGLQQRWQQHIFWQNNQMQ